MADVYACIYPSGYTLDAGELARYGATHRYTSMAAMEAGEDGTDWVTDTDNLKVEIIEGDGTFNWDGNPDTNGVSFIGWTNSQVYYSEIKTIDSARSSTGLYDTTAYILDVANDHCIGIDNATDIYLRFDGVQIRQTGSTNFRYLINIVDNVGRIEFLNCYLKNENSEAHGESVYYIPDSVSGGLDVWNTLVDDGGQGIWLRNDTARIMCCTISGQAADAIESDGFDVTVKNCAVFNNADDFQDAFTAITYCASDDADGTNAVDLNENAGGEWTASFTDYTTGDFTVKDASSPIYNAGEDLTSEFTDLSGETNPLGTDIIGTTRTTWDIGAFELISGGTIYDMSGTGQVGVEGIADLFSISVMSGPGEVGTEGSADLFSISVMSGAGEIAVEGSADIVNLISLAGVSEVGVEGTSGISSLISLLSSGEIAVEGSADIINLISLLASGEVGVEGSADLIFVTNIIEMAASGQIGAEGSADLFSISAMSGDGEAGIDGSALLNMIQVLAAGGEIAVEGSANLTSDAVIIFLPLSGTILSISDLTGTITNISDLTGVINV